MRTADSLLETGCGWAIWKEGMGLQEAIMAIVQGKKIELETFCKEMPPQVKERCERVAANTVRLLKLAKKEALYEEELPRMSWEHIERAVTYHDIGMVLVPERIINKTEPLTFAEKRVLQRHTNYGGKLLDQYRSENIQGPGEAFWRLAAETALSHHEWWDGTGYPYGLLATAIPLVSRAVHIIDAFDTIVHGTSYRMPLPSEYALLEIIDNAGKQFDPELTEIFRKGLLDREAFMKSLNDSPVETPSC